MTRSLPLLALLLAAGAARKVFTMRKIALVVAVLFAVPVTAQEWLPSGVSGVKARVSGFVNVREFGAAGDGVADDTAAIQAAINSYGTQGGPVVFPCGRFRTTATLTLKVRTSILGCMSTGGTQPPYTGSGGTIIDAQFNGVAIQVAANSIGNRFENFTIKLPNQQSVATENVTGIKADGSSIGFLFFENVTVQEGWLGFTVAGTNHTLINCQAQSQRYAGLVITSNYTQVLGGVYANALGYYYSGTVGANIFIAGAADHVTVQAATIDEAFGNGGSSVYVRAASHVALRDLFVYYTHPWPPVTSGGTAWGIRFGDATQAPTDSVIENVRVVGYPSSSEYPTAAIEVRGSRNTLVNVVADVSSNSGPTAISDLGTATRMYGVTAIDSGGTHYTAIKDPALPTSSPGAGTKQIYADSADSYRLKLAN